MLVTATLLSVKVEPVEEIFVELNRSLEKELGYCGYNTDIKNKIPYFLEISGKP